MSWFGVMIFDCLLTLWCEHPCALQTAYVKVYPSTNCLRERCKIQKDVCGWTWNEDWHSHLFVFVIHTHNQLVKTTACMRMPVSFMLYVGPWRFHHHHHCLCPLHVCMVHFICTLKAIWLVPSHLASFHREKHFSVSLMGTATWPAYRWNVLFCNYVTHLTIFLVLCLTKRNKQKSNPKGRCNKDQQIHSNLRQVHL